MRIYLFLFLFLVSGGLSLHNAYPSDLKSELESISFGITKETLHSKQGQYSKSLFTQLMKNLGYELKIIVFPALRLGQQTKAGKIDGELIRMSEYGKTRKFLTKVMEPHFHFSVVVYSTQKLKKLAKTYEQAHLKYGFRKGLKIANNELLLVSNPNQLIEFSDVEVALKLLTLGRIHAFVGIEAFIDERLKVIDKDISRKIHKSQTLRKDSAHVFLGKKFAFLAEDISKELRRMKKNGDAKKIKNQSEKGH